MRSNLAFATAVSLAALIAPVSAQARELRPVIPEELGLRSPLAPVWIPYRCSRGPVQNFYHRAYYGEPPATYFGYAYRPYYRYSAYRVVPRTYLCADE